MMRKDKAASKKGNWRIPENNLFLIAIAGGSVGIYSGMKYPLYHKTNKQHFKYGIPLLIGMQICVVIFLTSFNIL